MAVFAGRPRGCWQCSGCQRIKSLISSLLLIQQCPMNPNLCSRIEIVILGILSYISLFVTYPHTRTLYDLFNAALRMLVYGLSTFSLESILVSI